MKFAGSLLRHLPGPLTALLLAGAWLPAQAGTGALAVSAVVVSRSTCGFLTGARTLHFAIDPSTTGNVTNSVTVQFWCIGSGPTTTYSLTAGDGQNPVGSGLRRVRHSTTPAEYMQYALSITPASANIPWLAVQTVTVAGTVVPVDFRNARVGNYSDTVLLTLEP